MQSPAHAIGVDVAKAELVTATAAQEGSRKVVNDATAICAWLASLEPGSIVAMEATGKYHRLLAELAHASGMRVFVLNARDVHYYAKALGTRGKTDRLDAMVIARYAAEHHAELRAWQPAAGVEQQLQDLLNRRWVLTRQLVTLRLSLRDVVSLQAASEQLQQAYERMFEEIDRQLEVLVAGQAALAQGAARLQTIAGFGRQASIRLAAVLSKQTFANADAAVAYSGLDPRPCDSGAKKGKRRLSKRGCADLRRQLYLAAFAASHSKAYGPTYQALRARGLATTEAMVILARKLLRVAFAVWKSGKDFDASLIGSKSACQKT